MFPEASQAPYAGRSKYVKYNGTRTSPLTTVKTVFAWPKMILRTTALVRPGSFLGGASAPALLYWAEVDTDCGQTVRMECREE